MVLGRSARARGDVAVLIIPGIALVLGAVMVAEIGRVTHFTRPEQVSSVGPG